MERKTYILKVTEKNEFTKNKTFICNRNSDDYDKLYNDKYIVWFGYTDLTQMSIFNNDIEILEVLDYSNESNKDQGFINIHKKHYIDIFNADEENTVLCNKLLNNNNNNIRKQAQALYETIYDEVNTLSYSDIYTIIKNLWFGDFKPFFSLKRYELYNKYCDIDFSTLCVLIVFNKYLNHRYVERFKYPFDQKKIFYTIAQILKMERIGRK